ncbi:hypothetical protein CONPUDRAFT_149194 [Coniophora puteana RWD-64-598 SS2]|uniref:Galactose-binding like protein n=1 Tax=Coniophora puteana (strain RWD-64-598) TaxID=741705 RepID=A0A5M3N793_CONPW|nr:uncharacterized protein CONPUDRAFT_149194 [Coniophora puteana RWD-64-598 SS2]EIW87158.1 hypothetical protein CONPUDRAFT_149194 [Coniophora puteana RWD-64-598 SS2]
MSDDNLVDLINEDCRLVVSSTARRPDIKNNKKYMLDESEEQWTSEAEHHQFVQLMFTKPVVPRRLSILFSSVNACGFCIIEALASPGNSDWKELTTVDTVNGARGWQNFDLPRDDSGLYGLKITFEDAFENDGRGPITIYQLKLLGTKKDGS